MRWPHIEVSRKAVLAGLMTLSAVALLLPPRWTNPAKHIVQNLVPPQDLFYRAARRISASMSGRPQAGEASTPASATVECATLAAELRQLHDENQRLRGLRNMGLPNAIPILPARIVARDVAATRDSLLVARGSTRGVSAQDWAAGRLFIDQGRAGGVEEGQAALSRQGLLGRVEQASPYMSRVQLLTDLDGPRLEVRIGSREGPRFDLVDYPCSLRGAGDGVMRIDGVDYRFMQAAGGDSSPDPRRRIQVGDLVFTAPGQLGLPSPMIVGRVASAVEDPRKRLVYNLTVEPLTRIDELREIYIIPLVPAVPAALP